MYPAEIIGNDSATAVPVLPVVPIEMEDAGIMACDFCRQFKMDSVQS